MNFHLNIINLGLMIILIVIAIINMLDASSNSLNFDIKNAKLNLVEEEINLNENRNNTIIANNYYNSIKNRKANKLRVPAVSLNEKKILKLDELSNKLKQDALIDVFKIKLLELLDLDEAPKPQEIDINKSPVPEPIMREYNKLLRMSQYDDLRPYDSPSQKTQAFYSRRHRDKSEKNSHEFDANDEHIRFNSSLVQEVTLLPHKVKSKDDPAYFYLNQYNDWCNTFNQTGVTVLSCFKFSLEQKEFLFNDIKSAEMYIKLEVNKLNEMLEHLDEAAYLYVEVNGHLVKRIDLQRDYELESNCLFEYANVKEIIENVTSLNLNLNQKHHLFLNHQHHTKMSLRVRLLCSKSLTDSFSSNQNEAFINLFNKIDENVALRIKFGELKPDSIMHIRQRRQQQQQRWHSSSSDSSSLNRGHSRQRYGSSKHQSKNYRDCADLRRLGQTSANFTCCRETISFSMEQIGWSHWILSPKVIEYKYCRGGCISGISPRFDNTQIVYRMFELSNTFESTHCCNIYDYEEDIPFIYGSPPNYLTKMVSLNAKTCLCS